MGILLQLVGLIGVMLTTVGPVLGLMLLLNLRDRRQARLLQRVWQLIPKDLSDRIAIQVRCAMLSRWSVVTVEMQACSREEMWNALAVWPTRLPPKVRLLVNGNVDRGLPARFTVEATCRPPFCSPPQPSTVAG